MFDEDRMTKLMGIVWEQSKANENVSPNDVQLISDYTKYLNEQLDSLKKEHKKVTDHLVSRASTAEKKVEGLYEQITKLAVANAELAKLVGFSIWNDIKEADAKVGRLEKVVRLLLTSFTKDLQRSRGPGIVDEILSHPELFNVNPTPQEITEGEKIEKEGSK